MNSTRRSLICLGAALAATGALAGSQVFAPNVVRAQGVAGLPMPDVKALVFDTFGTVVDWRNGVARESERILKPMGYNLDWLAFADAWRKEYGPSMEEIRSGRRPFVKLDILHRENLDRLRPRFKLEKQRGIELANAFYTASRSGDMSALGAMLAADVSMHADGGGKRPASPDPIFGFDEVMKLHVYLAKQFQAHQSKLVRTGFINGLPGFVTLEADGELQTTTLDIEDGRISAIYVVRNPDKLRHLH